MTEIGMIDLPKLTDEELSMLCAKEILGWEQSIWCENCHTESDPDIEDCCEGAGQAGYSEGYSSKSIPMVAGIRHIKTKNYQEPNNPDDEVRAEELFFCGIWSISKPAHLQMIENKMVADVFSFEFCRDGDEDIAYSKFWKELGNGSIVDGVARHEKKHRSVSIAALKAKGVGVE